MRIERISLVIVAMLFALAACRSSNLSEHRIPDQVDAGATVYVVKFNGL